ncbi:hypothetical protein BIV57_21785 [Mangrovactinospora gilvigrisea]|uniref:Ferric oxidoreductase domain-containing protein n=1 Tax=Mangrovactinospora gilvigrisea TaxID=1428644 RepID=A0A1J7C1E9_9ACTN|nr:hypothetical protein BIV57_21785 [Mangrovactinospora gilvigrisea]
MRLAAMAGAPARGRRMALAAGTLAVLPVTVGGIALGLHARGMLDGAGEFLDYWAGVITLLSLTATVIWGQISTAGRFLGPRQRLWSQAVHRGTGVLGLCFLALHVTVKIAYGEVDAGGLLPGAADRERLYIGLGAVAAYLFVGSAVVGAMRSAFAPGRRSTKRWRLLHGTGYVAWCAALLHGLKAGRPVSSPMVTIGYAACLAAAALVLLLRAVRPGRLAPTPKPPADAEDGAGGASAGAAAGGSAGWAVGGPAADVASAMSTTGIPVLSADTDTDTGAFAVPGAAGRHTRAVSAATAAGPDPADTGGFPTLPAPRLVADGRADWTAHPSPPPDPTADTGNFAVPGGPAPHPPAGHPDPAGNGGFTVPGAADWPARNAGMPAASRQPLGGGLAGHPDPTDTGGFTVPGADTWHGRAGGAPAAAGQSQPATGPHPLAGPSDPADTGGFALPDGAGWSTRSVGRATSTPLGGTLAGPSDPADTGGFAALAGGAAQPHGGGAWHERAVGAHPVDSASAHGHPSPQVGNGPGGVPWRSEAAAAYAARWGAEAAQAGVGGAFPTAAEAAPAEGQGALPSAVDAAPAGGGGMFPGGGDAAPAGGQGPFPSPVHAAAAEQRGQGARYYPGAEGWYGPVSQDTVELPPIPGR